MGISRYMYLSILYIEAMSAEAQEGQADWLQMQLYLFIFSAFHAHFNSTFFSGGNSAFRAFGGLRAREFVSEWSFVRTFCTLFGSRTFCVPKSPVKSTHIMTRPTDLVNMSGCHSAPGLN